MKETIPQKEKKIQINGRKLPEKMSSVDINKNSQQNIAFKKRRRSLKRGKKNQPRSKAFLLNSEKKGCFYKRLSSGKGTLFKR